MSISYDVLVYNRVKTWVRHPDLFLRWKVNCSETSSGYDTDSYILYDGHMYENRIDDSKTFLCRKLRYALKIPFLTLFPMQYQCYKTLDLMCMQPTGHLPHQKLCTGSTFSCNRESFL